jgi:hypothetical protein
MLGVEDMPSVEAPMATGRDRVSNAGAVSSGAGESPSNRGPRPSWLRRMLRRVLGGLNEILKLSDFSRGDVFRD